MIVVADQSVASCYYLVYIAMCLTLLLQSAPAARLMLVAAGHSGSGPCITLHIMRCSTADPRSILIQYCTGRSFLQAPASIQTPASRPTLESVLDQFLSAARQSVRQCRKLHTEPKKHGADRFCAAAHGRSIRCTAVLELGIEAALYQQSCKNSPKLCNRYTFRNWTQLYAGRQILASRIGLH